METIYAMVIGVLLDCILGDPHRLPHPVRWIGSLIQGLEHILLPTKKRSQHILVNDSLHQLICGTVLTILVLIITGVVTAGIRGFAYQSGTWLGIVIDGILFYYCIAPKSLYKESMAVYRALPDLPQARWQLSMIVGRDTQSLTEEGIIKAAVETVAENTSDGVTAPIIYMALGGPVLCFLYKAVNTMDSMLGYHNEKYEFFGKTAARTDDVLNFIPARISACAMLTAAFLLSCLHFWDGEKPDPGRGIRIYQRDRKNHKSPNSAQTESVCAGVLGIQLAGDASYFGQLVHKPYIGDPVREIEREDIKRANLLMYVTAGITLGVCMLLRSICWFFG